MVDLVYGLSQLASNWLARVADVLPLGYAFSAGMVSAVNPCGFAMLPAYLGLYLRTEQAGFAQTPALRRIAHALFVSASVSAGFVVLFGAAGLVIASTGSQVVSAFPWIGLGVGVLLAAMGFWLLTGRTLYAGLAARLADGLGTTGRQGMRGFFMFGLGYGTASLSCTLPIFLTVVGSAMVVQGFGTAARQFLAYALGMGLVIVVLTLGLALVKDAVLSVVRKTLPHFQTVSAMLLLLAGVYIVYYWLAVGQLAQSRF